jgi:hypothetical protein
MVTVDEAISKGKRMLVYPSMSILFGTIGLGLLLAVSDYPPETFVICLFGGPILAVIYWNYTVTKWRIWAFENVRNVHELRKKAIRHKLLRREGNYFARTEFVNAEQKLQLRRLEKKFLDKDVYHEDLSVTIETQVFFSKPVMVFAYIFSLAILILGIYVAIANTTFIPLYFFLPIGGFLLYKAYKRYSGKAPQLVINALGIRIRDKLLIEWGDIQNDEIIYRREGKNDNHYLAISHVDGYDEILLNDLDITIEELEHKLQVHWFRFEKTHQ